MVETAIRQNRGSIAFYESGIYEVAGETPQLSSLREPAQRAVAALKDYQKWLEQDLLPRSNGDWRLGKEKFARKLELELRECEFLYSLVQYLPSASGAPRRRVQRHPFDAGRGNRRRAVAASDRHRLR